MGKILPNPVECFDHVQTDCLLTIDFETYYAKDYTLSKMTTESYIRDPRFECIIVGVKINDQPSFCMMEPEFRRWARTVNWARCAVLAHHAHFDGLILSHHFGIHPGFWFDTLSMARALHGTQVGGSLKKLMVHYEVGEKGEEVHNMIGKRLADFSPYELEAYKRYCANDCDGEHAILMKMLNRGFPESELWGIDTTVRMFTEPSFRLDEPLLHDYLLEERARKQELLDRIAREKSDLLSNQKFAQLLIAMGEDPPQKLSPRGNLTWAFAKTDPGMQALLEHDRDEIRWLAEARVGVKSTINETRTERFLKAGFGGRPVPVYLKYAAAHTFRWGGGDKMNFQNLERT